MIPITQLRNINPQQVASALRSIAKWASGFIASHGYASQSKAELIVGLVCGAAFGAWSWWAENDTNTLVKAAGVPGVQAVVVDSPTVADAVPDPKVTTPLGFKSTGLAFVFLLFLVPLLGACNRTTSQAYIDPAIDLAVAVVPGSVDVAIGSKAAEIAKYCGYVTAGLRLGSTADIFIDSPELTRGLAYAQAVVNANCDPSRPVTDVRSALNALYQAYQNVMLVRATQT